MKYPYFFLCYFETTRQCDQGCPHCMTRATEPPARPGLSTDEAKRLVLDELKLICPNGAVSFSGGEILQVLRKAVMRAGAPIELEGRPADDFAAADIGVRKSSGDHAAHVTAGFEKRHREAHACGADGRHDAAGSGAVDNQVVLRLGGQDRRAEQKEE